MIFATVGSHPTFAFQRLLDALGELPPDEVVVQHGPGRPPAGVALAVPWLSFADQLAYITEADIVVTHAGVGTIICARTMGHVPIVMPRLRRHAETVDDHQAELARALEPSGSVEVVWSPDDLVAAALAPRRRGPVARRAAETPLHAAVATALRTRVATVAGADRITVP